MVSGLLDLDLGTWPCSRVAAQLSLEAAHTTHLLQRIALKQFEVDTQRGYVNVVDEMEAKNSINHSPKKMVRYTVCSCFTTVVNRVVQIRDHTETEVLGHEQHHQ
jgi:anti-sigma factor ChrR (cupin superfamily)